MVDPWERTLQQRIEDALQQKALGTEKYKIAKSFVNMTDVSYEETETRLVSKYGIIRPLCDGEDHEFLIGVVKKKLQKNKNWKSEWINDALVERFLKANVSLDSAELAIEQYLDWRVKMKMDNFIADDPDIIKESAQGRSIVVPDQCDYTGRPIMLVFVAKHDRHHGNYDSLFKFCIYELEKLCRLSDQNSLKSFTIVFDLNGFGMKNMDFHYVQTFLHYLRDFYPERLGLGFIINYPRIFYGCWRIIRYWMNDVTKSKILFGGKRELSDLMDLDKLPVKLFK